MSFKLLYLQTNGTLAKRYWKQIRKDLKPVLLFHPKVPATDTRQVFWLVLGDAPSHPKDSGMRKHSFSKTYSYGDSS
jgi:hypothetical protein